LTSRSRWRWDGVRKAGAGPKRRTDHDLTLLSDLKLLLDGQTRGDPERPLLWTSKSVRKLAVELRALGHEVSYRVEDPCHRMWGENHDRGQRADRADADRRRHRREPSRRPHVS